MNDDRSRPERLGLEADGARERWFERLLQRIGLKSRESARDDLEDAVLGGVDGPDFSPQERAMIRNVLGFHRLRVEDAMVPRADIVAVPADLDLGEVLRVFRAAGHSRLPVYGDTLDDPLGMVHIRDFLDFIAARADARPATGDEARLDLSPRLRAAEILRPVLFVPRSMPALDLLVRMQGTRTHIALVIDEYGGTDGLVSIEDLVELVVGDIEDEHDAAEEHLIEADESGMLIADARAGLDEVSQAVGFDLESVEVADGVDTLGGLVLTLAGRVPAEGEWIEGPGGVAFEVLDADPRRVKRLRIRRPEAAAPAEQPSASAAP